MNLTHMLLAGSLLCCMVSRNAIALEDSERGIAQGTKQNAVQVTASESNIGVVYSNQEVSVSVSLTNQTDKSLQVRVAPRYAGDQVLIDAPISLAGNQNVTIKLAIQTESQSGNLVRYFDVFPAGVRDSGDPIGSFAVRGFVDWVVDPDSLNIDFGNVDVGKGAARDVELRLRPGAEIRLKGVSRGSSRFSAEVLGPKKLRLSSRSDAPLGLFDEYLVFSASDSDQKFVSVRVRGQFFAGVIPSSNPVDFGLVRTGDAPEQIIQLEDLNGKAIQIGSIRIEGVSAHATLQECAPQAVSCKNIKLKLSDLEARGLNKGKMFLELLPSGKIMPIHFGAVVIGKDTQIRNLEEDMKASAALEPPVSSILQRATQVPVRPLEMPKPGGDGPLLTWQATSEYGVFGYEVYRAESKDGPFKRVGEGIIPRLDKSFDKGSIYRWRDADYESGKTYWYYVNVVMENGTKREFTTPQKVVAK